MNRERFFLFCQIVVFICFVLTAIMLIGYAWRLLFNG